ncbi:MAG: ribosome silencing factor [Lentisphaerae bacterium]|jgi:ribosome-associated protein|nr:ribosome silencing factor [Lentisphaerota bacterium]MBT4817983.1 ribosome silencing factor [Lentisphaerota bacterium]MBT5605582.1 ribosome silencing factor [Lentisphaerota bacterium]MBT7054854.1 ribosome silencing factor [Lentisphaerota bacterium]MBT7841599.1 ribosome silencing factor [Lentisphaerota bacterium]
MEPKVLTDEETEKLARACVDVCEGRKAQDIALYDVRGSSILADFYIICSANSDPHIRAVCDALHRELGQTGRPPRVEGNASSQWVIADCGPVLVHVLDPERREYYRLEELWDEGSLVYRSPEED